jgi:type I restriction enzyme S subunit
MKWCLRAKLASNWASFSDLLLQTGERPIVEDSRKDEFWGAKPGSDDCLIGQNVLGRLLMELREKLRTAPETIQIVEPVPIPDFLLLSEPIRAIARPSTSHPIPPHNRTDRRVEQTAYI